MTRRARAVALAFRGAGQGRGQFGAQGSEITLHTAVTADEDVVMVGQPAFRQRRPQEFAKAPFHPVADHGVTDLLGHRYAVPLALPAIGIGQQHETRARNAQPPIRGEEVAALADHGKRWMHGSQIRERAPEWEPASIFGDCRHA